VSYQTPVIHTNGASDISPERCAALLSQHDPLVHTSDVNRARSPQGPLPTDTTLPFLAIRQAVIQYAEPVLGRITGEAYEALKEMVEGLNASLQTNDRMARQMPSMLMSHTHLVTRNFDDLINELHRWGFEDTAPLQTLRQVVSDWLEVEEAIRLPSLPV
jgi:hypothetical protein